MGLIIAVLMTGSYSAALLLTTHFLRAWLLVRNIFIYLVVLALSACFLLFLNLIVCVWVLGIAGFDTEFVGAGFAYMGAFIFSTIVMVLILIKETWRAFRDGARGKI